MDDLDMRIKAIVHLLGISFSILTLFVIGNTSWNDYDSLSLKSKVDLFYAFVLTCTYLLYILISFNSKK